MNGLALVAAAAVGCGLAGAAALVVPPTRGLADRVRPYAVAARSALGHPPGLSELHRPAARAGAFSGVFGPLLWAVIGRVGAAIEKRGDEQLARLLRQAGMHDTTPEQYRVRQVGEAAAGAALAGAAVVALGRGPLLALVAVVAGFAYGGARSRRRVERRIEGRTARTRQELYTVNHLLAMQVRSGSGPLQAVRRVVDRGSGVVVEELAEVLALTRRGTGEAEAFRFVADSTPEPSAARTYLLLAAAIERGADLAAGLLALSEDIRDARREALHKEAVRRRAAMLVPTIAILAPIMLLFIAAPLPSVVLGNR